MALSLTHAYICTFSLSLSLSLSLSQDGPGEGTIIKEPGGDGWVRVRWDNGAVNSYRMGDHDRYDLTLAPSELESASKEGETKDEPEDADISVCEFPSLLFVWCFV